MNISSVAVRALPQNVQSVVESLRNSDLCEVYHFDEDGRIVVVIEGTDTGEEMQKLQQITAVRHVLSADMVYSYSENELESLYEQIQAGGESAIEKVLSDEMGAEEVKYSGKVE